MSNQRTCPEGFRSLFIALMGLAAFLNMTTNPRLAMLHAIDVVRLVGSGLCFGAVLATLLIFFGGRRSGGLASDVRYSNTQAIHGDTVQPNNRLQRTVRCAVRR
jgi:hypothetical protein